MRSFFYGYSGESMQLYLAPMEELTGYIFRNAIEKHFGYIDKYFTPFITPNQNKILKTKDGREIIPEHNEGMNTVVQVLTNNAEHFIELAYTLIELGYEEININCGCPSNTVVKKNRGSGFFRDLYILDEFLEGVFASEISDKVKLSVKTRVGLEDDQDFEDIMRIYNKYPISELTIHPRIQKDYYTGKPRMELFDYGLKSSNARVCYNGDIFGVNDYNRIAKEYAGIIEESRLNAIMIGRGAIANPGIFREIRTGQKMTAEELKCFHDDLFETYASTWSEKDALFKLKEIWGYIGKRFVDVDKQLKAIRKSSNRQEFMSAANMVWKADMVEYKG